MKPIAFYYERLGRILKNNDAVPLLSSEIADLRAYLTQLETLKNESEVVKENESLKEQVKMICNQKY